MTNAPRIVRIGELKKAVYAGDTLTLTWRVLDAHWKESLNGDLAQFEGRMVNQRGETVVLGRATILVMPRSGDKTF